MKQPDILVVGGNRESIAATISSQMKIINQRERYRAELNNLTEDDLTREATLQFKIMSQVNNAPGWKYQECCNEMRNRRTRENLIEISNKGLTDVDGN